AGDALLPSRAADDVLRALAARPHAVAAPFLLGEAKVDTTSVVVVGTDVGAARAVFPARTIDGAWPRRGWRECAIGAAVEAVCSRSCGSCSCSRSAPSSYPRR